MKIGSKFTVKYVLVENTNHNATNCVRCCFPNYLMNDNCPKTVDGERICNVIDKGKNRLGDAYFKMEYELE